MHLLVRTIFHTVPAVFTWTLPTAACVDSMGAYHSRALPVCVPRDDCDSSTAAAAADDSSSGESWRGWFSRYSINRIKNPDDCVPAEYRFWHPIFRPFDIVYQKVAATSGCYTRNLFRWLHYNILILCLVIFMNMLPALLIVGCKPDSCDADSIWERTKKELHKTSHVVMSAPATFFLLSWYAFQFILAALPIGQVVRYENRETGQFICVRQNAVISLFCSMVLLFGALRNKSSLSFLHESYLAVSSGSLFMALLIALLIHMRSIFVDPSQWSVYGVRSCFPWNFFVGKVLHPLVKGMDVKRFFSLRPGMTLLVIIDWCLLLYHLTHHKVLNVDLLLLTVMHFVYVLQALALEVEFMTSFRYTREGFGYMHAWFSLVFVPIVLGYHTEFVFRRPKGDPGNSFMVNSLAFGLFVSGMYLLFVSSKHKAIFRRMRCHPKVTYLVHTRRSENRGVSFIASGPWGACRHPNIIAELMMILSFSLLTGHTHYVPYLPWTLLLLYSLFRMARKEVVYDCDYGQSWRDYCRTVHRLFLI